MKRLVLSCSWLTPIFLGGCALGPHASPTDSARLDVSELTIRAIYASSTRSNPVAAICFPNFADPQQRFIDRLAPLRAVPCSALKDHRATEVQVVAKTGAPAITIYIMKISTKSTNKVVVTASEWMEALNGGGYVFELERTNGKWKITNKSSTWEG